MRAAYGARARTARPRAPQRDGDELAGDERAGDERAGSRQRLSTHRGFRHRVVDRWCFVCARQFSFEIWSNRFPRGDARKNFQPFLPPTPVP